MNLMIPSTRHKDYFILFLSALQPDSLHHEYTTREHTHKSEENLKSYLKI